MAGHDSGALSPSFVRSMATGVRKRWTKASEDAPNVERERQDGIWSERCAANHAGHAPRASVREPAVAPRPVACHGVHGFAEQSPCGIPGSKS